MDQATAGTLIAQRRKVKNLTQSQLAEKLGVSNKTVSKWETGRCMPDYSLVRPLCRELDISVEQLLGGCGGPEKGTSLDEERLLSMLRHIQKLEREKNILYSLLLVVFGIALLALSHVTGGSAVQDFISGAMLGISVPVMLIGIYLAGRYLFKN